MEEILEEKAGGGGGGEFPFRGSCSSFTIHPARQAPLTPS